VTTTPINPAIAGSNKPMNKIEPAIWFPAIMAGTGADTFTKRLSDALRERGYRSEITWLPHYAEVFPYSVTAPKPPDWANVVHVNSWLHKRFIPTNLPCVSTIHGCFHVEEANCYKTTLQNIYHRSWIYPTERTNITIATALSAVSRYTAEASAKVFGRKDITPILNWIDTETFQAGQRSLPGRPFKLLFVGTISDRKGRKIIPEIMKLLGAEFELYYTGLPSEFRGTKKLPENMLSIGKIDDVTELAGYYQKSDALLFPTYLEGFGLTVAEAMASGLPVVTTDCSSLPELVEHEETGILCPTGDIAAFVKAIKRLSEDSILWQRLSERSRLSAENKFHEDRALEEYLRLYYSILAGPSF